MVYLLSGFALEEAVSHVMTTCLTTHSELPPASLLHEAALELLSYAVSHSAPEAAFRQRVSRALGVGMFGLYLVYVGQEILRAALANRFGGC